MAVRTIVASNGVIAVSLPAWKLQDEFAQMMKYPNRVRSAYIGSIGFHISPTGVKLEKYLYKHPAVHVEEIL